MKSNKTVALPKDAEGREIPLDTKVLYDEYGRELRAKRVEFDPFSKEWRFAVQTDSPDGLVVYRNSRVVYLEKQAPPDSWEKLLDDLDRAVENNDAFFSMECAYMNQAGDMCGHCKFHDPFVRDCLDQMVEDIAARIRKLRGEE